VGNLNYEFFKKTAHPDDLAAVTAMHEAVLQYVDDACKEKIEDVGYFSCTFRLQRLYSFFPYLLSQMVYQRMKPVVMGGKARYLACSMVSSVIKKAGNLRMYRKDGLGYEAYDFRSKRWRQTAVEALTERERAMLMLAKQGKSSKEIADTLCVAEKTVSNLKKNLYGKLGVHTMEQAVIFATNHRMIFATEPCSTQQAVETAPKRTRQLLTPDILLRIQQGVNNKLSINSIAKKEAISEGAIRYAIKQGKITRNS
jgi:DNA-binding CsgD family transcriptional regulator